MQVTRSAGLDQPKLKALRKLVDICQKKDGQKVRVYWNIISKKRYIPGDFCVIDQRRLVAYLGIFVFNDNEAEISVLVNPKYRGKGIFSELLQRAKELVRPLDIETMVFCCPAKLPAALACLKQYDAKLRHTEYDMRWKPDSDLKFVENPAFSKRFATEADLEDMIAIDVACFHNNYDKVEHHFTENLKESNREAWMLYDEDNLVGKIHFRYDANNVAFIHNVCVKPELQGRGYGSYFLKNAIKYLVTKGHRHIRLDVEAVNEGALSLYTRLGFVITQAYEFWETPIYRI